MDLEEDTNTIIDIFEVFKVDSLNIDQLVSLPFEKIQQTYTQLVPIDSIEQLREANAIAQIPKPSHMIVDRDQFKKMLLTQSTGIAAKRTCDAERRMDNAIASAKHVLVNEVISTLTKISSSLKQDFESIRLQLSQVWNGDNNHRQKDIKEKNGIERDDDEGERDEWIKEEKLEIERKKEALEKAFNLYQQAALGAFELLQEKKKNLSIDDLKDD